MSDVLLLVLLFVVSFLGAALGSIGAYLGLVVVLGVGSVLLSK